MRVWLSPHNTKYIVLLAIACLVALSIYIHSRGSKDKKELLNKINFLPSIPESINNTIKDVKVFDRFVNITFNEHTTLSIHLKECKPLITTAYSVIFLHGASFSSETWVKLNSLQLAAALGYNAYAVDLPGWGKSKSTPKSKSGKMVITESLSKSFLKAFIATLEISLPVIVTPSMSGMFSINYVMDPEPRSCHERVRGLLALAPSNTEEYLYSQYHKCDVPVMIVFGSEDKNLGLISTSYLRNMPYYDIFRIEGAGHACYLDKPDQFYLILHYFLRGLKTGR